VALPVAGRAAALHRPQESDYTHYAFSIDENDFAAFVARLTQAGVTSWKENKSEGESFYFLDPDGHKLEAHGQPRAAAGRLPREAVGNGVF
jgi:catechol 2,3-dioxygenase-like lactoylglutathione lyase family enzyme